MASQGGVCCNFPPTEEEILNLRSGVDFSIAKMAIKGINQLHACKESELFHGLTVLEPHKNLQKKTYHYTTLSFSHSILAQPSLTAAM